MPIAPKGLKTLVRYPDGTSKVITLYTRPVAGQIIAHGWSITAVEPGADEGAGIAVEYRIWVERPPTEGEADKPSPEAA